MLPLFGGMVKSAVQSMEEKVFEKTLTEADINKYFRLIELRSLEVAHYPKIYSFSTEFSATFLVHGYSSVANYGLNVNIMRQDVLLVPVNKYGKHWTLIVVDFRLKLISYIDSLHTANKKLLNRVLRYVELEFKNKHHASFDKSAWQLESVKGKIMPKYFQDSAVFICYYAECIARNAPVLMDHKLLSSIRNNIIVQLQMERLYPVSSQPVPLSPEKKKRVKCISYY